MPITSTVHQDLDLVHVVYSGVVTVRELLEYVDQIYDMLDRGAPMNRLTDLRGMTELRATEQEIASLKDLMVVMQIRNALGMKLAIVATSDVTRSLIANMVSRLKAVTPDLEIVQFEQIEPALDFLGINTHDAARFMDMSASG